MSSSNFPQVETVPVIYRGVCGKPTPDGTAYLFKYTEQAPRLLCDRPPFGELDPHPDANGQYLVSVVERHNTELLMSRAWLCQVCGNPAKELYHGVVPRLRPGQHGFLGCGPFIWDTVVPICRSGGACDRTANKWADAFGRESMPTLEQAKCCERCGKVTGVKFCLGCKVIA
ncbi:hypothetical protein MMC16_002804 [Acarospora aff. strigata]|nr:hypothetical protein [Acarospora aff. strigata]